MNAAGSVHKSVYRAGLIGCGRIGADAASDTSSRLHCHAQAARECGRVRLEALCDPDEERLRRAANRWGVERTYTDHQEMLAREKLDLISICSPTPTHAAVFKDALECGGLRGILLEKPLASTPDEAARMVELARISPAIVSVNYGRRFCPVYQKAFREIREGRIGKVFTVHGLYTKGIYNNGTHLLDLLHWALGDPADLVPSEELSAGDDPTWSFRWIGPGGVTGWIQGADHRIFNVFEVDFLGTEGRYRFTDQGHRLERYGVENVVSSFGFRQLEAAPAVEQTGFRDSVRFALEDLVECMETGRTPACSLEQGARLLAWAGRMMEQSVR